MPSHYRRLESLAFDATATSARNYSRVSNFYQSAKVELIRGASNGLEVLSERWNEVVEAAEDLYGRSRASFRRNVLLRLQRWARRVTLWLGVRPALKRFLRRCHTVCTWIAARLRPARRSVVRVWSTVRAKTWSPLADKVSNTGSACGTQARKLGASASLWAQLHSTSQIVCAPAVLVRPDRWNCQEGQKLLDQVESVTDMKQLEKFGRNVKTLLIC